MPIKPDGAGKWQVALMAYSAESTPNYKGSLGAIAYSDYQAAKTFPKAKPFPSDLRLIGVAISRLAHLDRATKPHAVI